MSEISNHIFLPSSSRASCRGATLVEVLVYIVLATGLLSLLIFFLIKTTSYHAFVTDKVKLSEASSLLIGELKQDFQHTILSRVTLYDDGDNRQVVLDFAEAVEPDGSLKWSDSKICYAFLAQENKVYRWIGSPSELDSKVSSGDFRSWPYIEKFELEKATPRTLKFEILMTFEDSRERTHRYTAGGSIDVMGGHPVK